MAETVVIDVVAKFTDQTTSGANKSTASVDRLSKSIEKTKKQAENITKSKWRMTIDAVDKASQVIQKIKSVTAGIAGKTFRFTMGIIDKATSPLRSILNFATSIKGIVTGILLGVVAKKTLFDPITLADSITKAEIGFETLFRSKEKATKMMGDINQFAKETPFKTQGVISQTQKMIAMGWKPDNIIGDLRVIGDAAAGTGKGDEGLASITYALSEIKSKGKLSTQELNQLASAGIKAKAYIAQGLGFGTSDAGLQKSAKAIEDGLVGADQAIKYIMKGMKEFEGMMDKTANKTVEGLKSQIEDAFEISVISKWGRGLQRGAIEGLGKIVGLLSDSEKGLTDIGAAAEEFAYNLSNKAAAALGDVINKLQTITSSDAFKGADFGGKIKILWGEVITKPLNEWWNGDGGQSVRDIGSKVGKFIGDGIIDGVKLAFSNPITATIATIWGLGKIGGIVKGAKDFGGLFGAGKAAAGAAGGAAEAAGAANSVGILTKGAGLAKIAIAALSGPVGWVLGSIALIGGGLYLLKKNQEKVNEELFNTGDRLKKANEKYNDSITSINDTKDALEKYKTVSEECAKFKGPSEELTKKEQEREQLLQNLKTLYPKVFENEESVDAAIKNLDREIEKEKELARVRLITAFNQEKGNKEKLESKYADSTAAYEAEKNRLDNLNKIKSQIENVEIAIAKFDNAGSYGYPSMTDEQKQIAKGSIISDMQTVVDMAKKDMPQLSNLWGNYLNTDVLMKNNDESVRGVPFKFNLPMEGAYSSLQEKSQDTETKMNNARAQADAAASALDQMYQTELAIINLNFGGNIAETVKNWDTLGQEGKTNTQNYISAVDDLNARYDAMNGKVVKVTIEEEHKKIVLGESPRAFANGNIIDRPTVALMGEAGPEAIIPLSEGRRQRGRDLWERAGRMLGVTPFANGGIVGKSNSSPAVSESPSIKIDLGGVNFNIEGSNDPNGVVSAIQANLPQITNTIAEQLAKMLSKTFNNMPSEVEGLA